MTAESKSFTLTNQEASALAPVIEISCTEASKQFSDVKSKKLSPLVDESFAARTAISSCVETSYTQVQASCAEEYSAYFDCIGPKLRKPYVKCIELKTALQKCVAKNKIGELKDLA